MLTSSMIIDISQTVGAILIAVVCHEYAHGWVANKLGDPTAKLSGRLTLNPLKHIDPVGMIVVPVLLRIFFGFAFGWAKPVPVNFSRLRNPKTDVIWVGIAGPLTNFILAVVFSVVLHTVVFSIGVQKFLSLVVLINLVLGVFNLIPIPPLDGSRIIMGLLPREMERAFARIEPFGFIIVIVLLNFGFLNFIWDIVQKLAFALGIKAF